MWLILSILAVIIAACYYYYLTTQQFWLKRGFEIVSSDVTGNIFVNIVKGKLFGAADIKIYDFMKANQKPFLATTEFTKPALVVRDPELLRLMFVKNFDNFVNRRPFILKDSEREPMFSTMLFFQENQQWKELRSIMSPTFTTGKMKRMFQIFDSSSKKFVQYLKIQSDKANGEINFSECSGKYLLDIIASAAFGFDAGIYDVEVSQFELMSRGLQLKMSFKLISALIFALTFSRLAALFGVSIINPAHIQFFRSVILNAIKDREKLATKREDFLQLLLEVRNGQLKAEEEQLDNFEKDAQLLNMDKKKFTLQLTNEVIVANCIQFLAAGYDTTQSLLMFGMYQLAMSPDIQNALYEEINLSMQENDGQLTYDAINHMDLMDRFVLETLRLYPPGSRIERVPNYDYKIPNTNLVLPKESFIIIPLHSIHHDEEYYPEPQKFDPDRFTPEEKAKRHPLTFIPFGMGPRSCIGLRFAIVETKMLFARVIHEYILEPCERTPIPMELEFSNTTRPKQDIWLKIKQRN